ncbi:MAG: Asparagine synthetase (glutamine-hydrolyzing) [Nitrosopumilales archaeon]|nr:MAG: Asparagine synthetase (glutamine-hydrolyzing) [Nitrosopumilales archaeon]
MTGDGADELFAGYNFLLNKSEEDIEKDLKRIWLIMHFPSIKLGKDLGVTVETPFLNDSVQEFAKSLPVSMKVGIKDDKKYGKWILRKAFEDKIPKSIAWRDKHPLQDGAGTSGLITLFDSVIIDDVFQKKKKEILEADGVNIRTKESLHYYEIYRKYYDEPAKLLSSDIKCPYCQFAIEQNSKFCRMCGAFPI